MSLSEATPEAIDSNNSLILDSLEIKNFRAFRHLTIEKLGRVNLITGKNNVGKTSLLEALWLYARKGSVSVLRDLLSGRSELRSRNETASNIENNGEKSENIQIANARYLFNGRNNIFDGIDSISIGSHHLNKKAVIALQWFSVVGDDDDAFSSRQLIPIKPNQRFDVETPELYVISQFSGQVESRYRLDRVFSRIVSGSDNDVYRNLLVKSEGLTINEIGLLWDSITATALEDVVLESLKIICPSIERIVFVVDQQRNSTRAPMVKMVGLERMPLRSLGDGVNHLLGIVLALVNARNSILMLDEIENGIHYSVLSDVWRFIFQTARRLNVQVFATTHSWDCIEAFQQAAAEDDDPNSGVLVRLQNDDGDVSATVFDERRLAIVTRQGIEVR